MVYVEQLTSSLYLDKRDDVERYTEVMEQLMVVSAPAQHTDEILAAIVEQT